jgi:hypothetical protein
LRDQVVGSDAARSLERERVSRASRQCKFLVYRRVFIADFALFEVNKTNTGNDYYF